MPRFGGQRSRIFVPDRNADLMGHVGPAAASSAPIDTRVTPSMGPMGHTADRGFGVAIPTAVGVFDNGREVALITKLS